MAAPIVVQIRVAWWFRYLYVPGVMITARFCCHVLGIDVQPDAKKIAAMCMHAVSLYMRDARGKWKKQKIRCLPS